MNRQNGNKGPVEGIAFSIFGILFMLYWTYTAVTGGAYAVGLLFGGLAYFIVGAITCKNGLDKDVIDTCF